LYTDSVLVPQQAEREAERQVGALTVAARSAGISEARALSPVLEHAWESAGDRILWIRLLNAEGQVVAQSGHPAGIAKVPAHWWERVERHESLGSVADTAQGKAFVAILPFRLPHPLHFPEPETKRPDLPLAPPNLRHPPGYAIELAIPLTSVAGSFAGLRQNLIVGVIASIALLLSLAVIGLRAPHYLRGRYLEGELQLARRVQSDLQPKAQPVSAFIEFGAAAVAADHVGGDFYDIFEAEAGKIGVVLGDVSGKGVPAALLVNVLQGAIRSSTASLHELACERINRMLCERTACERFATLFWGVFDPATSTLRYVNAGHAAPMLVRKGHNKIERLDQGGPVLGLLHSAAYSTGIVAVDASDMLILYSDGINEATNQNNEEFGEDRISRLISNSDECSPAKLCGQIMKQVALFARAEVEPDDRTLLVVRFPEVAHVCGARIPAKLV
jgi:hypothetical protein